MGPIATSRMARALPRVPEERVPVLTSNRTLYEIGHVLLLGRVTTGSGGHRIHESALETLRTEDPKAAEEIVFHSVSERDERHGQAAAAASLPAFPG